MSLARRWAATRATPVPNLLPEKAQAHWRPRTAPGPDGLTDRQREIFNLFYAGARDRGYQPSHREVAAAAGDISPRTVITHLRRLAAMGWIKPGDSRFRAIQFLRRPDGRSFEGFADKP